MRIKVIMVTCHDDDANMDDDNKDYNDDNGSRCAVLFTCLIIKITMMITMMMLMMMTIWKRMMMMTMTLGEGSCPHVRPC